jgi:D-beta-D-heptose 7-phosphate kinase/D-beta-D-heptose 1-phosphate adenosyltransferase
LAIADRSTLATRVPALAGVKVLCVGDVMLDRYVYGTVERVSPEAPIPVLHIARERSMLGGAGNVVRNLVAIGAQVIFIAVIGDDETGRAVADLVRKENGIDFRPVVEPGRKTGVKTRFVAGSQQLLRADDETTRPLALETAAKVAGEISAAMVGVSAVVISDYGKGGVRDDNENKVIRTVVDRAGIDDHMRRVDRANSVPVIVDPKGTDFSIYKGACLITPNRAELAAATNKPVGTDDEIRAAANTLLAGHDFQAVLATRGPDGMTLVRPAAKVDHLSAEAREVFDVSGAGDTVVAVVAAALAARIDILEAAQLANVAAGIVVGKAGTAVAYPDEIVAALHAQELLSHEAKVAPLPQALDRIETWRRQGLKIGFTNGCFDLLHPGHISLLDQARAACDRLVVGLNSDASVVRLKGPSRPIQHDSERAIVLASLASVDLVVIFAEDTPLELIRAIRPDVLVKGADYTVETVVGADFVQGYGGKVLLAELAPGHSTSATLARLGR